MTFLELSPVQYVCMLMTSCYIELLTLQMIVIDLNMICTSGLQLGGCDSMSQNATVQDLQINNTSLIYLSYP